ncbi:MAG: hypothetical protein JWP00_3700 [Chloroflexi bacterium]|nr:hypothetical protein [Chloroflexota bacterium]
MAEVLTNSTTQDSKVDQPDLTRWQRLYQLIDRHSGRLLLAGMCLYILVFSVASFYKYETYQTGYDQIYFEQPLWNTSNGRFMEQSDFAYSTSAFAVDWMPILVLFTPFYWLLPSPHTLFFIETLILALGALPIFWLARDKFKSRPAGLLLAAVYLLNPTLEYFNLLPFNLRAPGLVCLLFAFYFFEKGAKWRFALFALLAIATRTEVSLIIAMFGVYGFLNRRRISWKLWVPPLVIGPVYFVIIFSFILPAFITPGTMVAPPETQPIQISQAQRDYISNTDTIISTTYGDLGKNLPDVLKNTLTNPLKTIERVITIKKIEYLLLMLLPFAFLPLFSPRVLLFALPIVAINLLSIRTTQFDYKSHYSALLLFPLAVGSIYGAANLLAFLKKWRFTASLKLRGLPLASLGTVLAVLLLVVLATQVIERNPLPGVIRNAEKKAMIDPTNALISRIPAEASVSVTSFLGPHILPRRYIYPFPLALYSPPLQAVQYFLIDTNAAALYLKDNGTVFGGDRPIDWFSKTTEYKLVDSVVIKGQSKEGKTREIQLWQRVGPNVPPYTKPKS